MQRKRRRYNTKRLKYYLHSIPKLLSITNRKSLNSTYSNNKTMLKNNVRSTVLYSIPSVVVLVFLFGLITMLNPTTPAPNSLSLFSNNFSLAYAEEDNTTTTQPAIIGDSTASMTLDTSNIEVDASLSSVAYASKDITINAVNVEQYTITITGPTGLSMNSSGSGNNIGTQFVGADSSVENNGNTPDNMPDNSWGYAYSNTVLTSDTELSTLAYKSLTGTAQELERGTSSYGNTRTLAFAAKFGSDTIAGKYSADITLSLVALPNKVVFDGITTMQEMTPEICEGAEKYDTSMLRDTRDNNWYRVTKLDDGRCWMTSNLALSAPVGGRVLTSEDSNVTTNWTMPATLTDEELGEDTGDVCQKNFYNGGGSSNTACFTKAQSYIGVDNADNSTGYYSWCAATAESCSSVMGDSVVATTSVCPKGWRLPNGYSKNIEANEFYDLFNALDKSIYQNSSLAVSGHTNWSNMAISLATVQGMPYNFSYTGYVYNGIYTGQINIQGSNWWSSTRNASTTAYNLLVADDGVRPGTGSSSRFLGYAVRCIAEESTPLGQWEVNGITIDTDITTMQEMTSSVCDRVSTPASTATDIQTPKMYLKDSRDGNIYTIRKYPDGKCWMEDNLVLSAPEGGRVLTPGDSDVSSNWTMPATLTSLSEDSFSSIDPTIEESFIAYNDLGKKKGYYTWTLATVSSKNANQSNAGVDASNSICPKGWRLPTSNNYGDFKTLTDALNFTTTGSAAEFHGDAAAIQQTPYSFSNSSYIFDGSFGSDRTGRWWSSTVYISSVQSYNNTAFSFIARNDYLAPSAGNSVYMGEAIRCIAR